MSDLSDKVRFKRAENSVTIELPDEMSDGRANMHAVDDYVIVVHPDHKPLKIWKDGRVKVLKAVPPGDYG